jgi:hypothetical protein
VPPCPNANHILLQKERCCRNPKTEGNPEETGKPKSENGKSNCSFLSGFDSGTTCFLQQADFPMSRAPCFLTSFPNDIFVFFAPFFGYCQLCLLMMNRSDSPQPSRGTRRFSKWLLLSFGLIALLVAWNSATPRVFQSLAAALLVCWLLSLPSPASATKWFSKQIPPAVVVLVTTLCLGLLLLEVTLRLFFFQWFPDFARMTSPNLGYEYHPRFGWFPVPNSRESFDFIHQTISISHNSNGFRDIEPSFDSRPGVLFLGDSFVWGYGVETGVRFTERLRTRHPEWQIYNCGVAGYGTDQEFLLLQEYLQKFHPRVVFLVFCTENDHLDNCSHGDGTWVFKPYFSLERLGLKLHGIPVPQSDRVFYLQQPLLSKSYLCRLAMRAWGNFRSPAPRATSDPTTAILAAVNQYVLDHGAIFCVGLTSADRDVERFLKRSNIPWLDLSTELRLEGDWHWSSSGNAFVAEKIDRFLSQTSTLKRNPDTD